MPPGTDRLMKMVTGVGGGRGEETGCHRAQLEHTHVLDTGIPSEFHALVSKHLCGPLRPECKFETLVEDKKEAQNRKIYPRSLTESVKAIGQNTSNDSSFICKTTQVTFS